LVVVGGLSACATYHMPPGAGRAAGVRAWPAAVTDSGLARYTADMDPGHAGPGPRHDPRPHKDYWGRVPGWEKLNLHRIPRLGDRDADFEEARVINGFKAGFPAGAGAGSRPSC
jgi:spore germination cell wall hydrolase CwlJ-like protein